MNLKTLATHTVDVEPQAWKVLDVGCRDFDFANELASRVGIVHAFDPAPDVLENTAFRNIVFHRAAVVGVGKGGHRKLVTAGNGSRVDDGATFSIVAHEYPEVERALGPFDIVKLDCEGSEYDILLSWPGPTAKQITVEFHEHTKRGKDVHGPDIYDRIDKHLGRWYAKIKDDPMDTLWVLK